MTPPHNPLSKHRPPAMTENEAKAMQSRNPTLVMERYSKGSFTWEGSQRAHIENWNADAPLTSTDVVAIFFRRGQDRHGPLVRVWCLIRPEPVKVSRRQTLADKLRSASIDLIKKGVSIQHRTRDGFTIIIGWNPSPKDLLDRPRGFYGMVLNATGDITRGTYAHDSLMDAVSFLQRGFSGELYEGEAHHA